MQSIVKRVLASFIAFSIVAAVAGCKRETGETDKPQPAESSVAQVPTIVEEIIIGTGGGASGTPPAPLTPQDDIEVILKTSVPSNGGNMEVALFDIGNGKQVGLQSQHITPEHTGTIKLTFRNEEDWAPGRYMLEVKIDGKLAGQRDFDINDLPSPSEQS